ncbi:MAG: type II secretion system protein N [Pseudomonadota bacterium]
MFSKKGLFILGILVLAVGLVAKMPARMITERISAPGLSINDVSGTIWNGRIRQLVINNEPVAPVSWKLEPSSLFGGGLAGQFAISPPDSSIRGAMYASFDGSLELSDVQIQGSLREIASGSSLGPVAGSIDGTIAKARLADERLQSLLGKASIFGLRYPAEGGMILGDFKVDCPENSGPQIVCEIRDIQSPLELDATITLDGTAYALKGTVRAKRNAPANLTQSLQFLGRPDAVGNHQLQMEGRLD